MIAKIEFRAKNLYVNLEKNTLGFRNIYKPNKQWYGYVELDLYWFRSICNDLKWDVFTANSKSLGFLCVKEYPNFLDDLSYLLAGPARQDSFTYVGLVPHDEWTQFFRPSSPIHMRPRTPARFRSLFWWRKKSEVKSLGRYECYIIVLRGKYIARPFNLGLVSRKKLK